jgi:hypothetical protein
MFQDGRLSRRAILQTSAGAGIGAASGCTRSDGEAPNTDEAGAQRSGPVSEDPAATEGLPAPSKPTGWVGQYSTTVDPADFDDDSAAIQALVDDLFVNMGDGTLGHLFLPQTKADGSAWNFPRTVSFGSDADREGRDDGRGVVLPRGRGARIKSTIDDGSPVFHVDPANVTKCAQTFGGFHAHGSGNDNEFVRITSVIGWELKNVWFGAFAKGPESTGAIVADANAYNWFLYNIQWWGGGGRQADVIAFDDSRDVPNPATDGHMMLDIHGECRNGVNANGVGSRCSIGGHIEGASNAGVKWDNGTIFVTDECWMWQTHGDDANHLQFDDCLATVGNFYAGRASGDMISLGPDMHAFHVEPFKISTGNVHNDSGDALSIAGDAGERAPCSVPYPEQLLLPFDVTPLVGNDAIRFPNGLSLGAVGTLDVPAGGTRRVSLQGSGAATRSGADVRFDYQENHSGVASISRRLSTEANGNRTVEFTEESGSSSASIAYRIYH